MTVSNSPYVCVPCRYVAKQTSVCPHCRGEMIHMSYRWRAPRRTNRRAWALIASGVWLWDRRVHAARYPWASKRRYTRSKT